MKQATFYRLAVIPVFAALLVMNTGDARGESQTDNLLNARSSAKLEEPRTENLGELQAREAKSARYREMEWIIRQQLLQKYERIEIEEQDAVD